VTNSRHINFASSNSIIDTNGHNATFGGPMTSFLGDSLKQQSPRRLREERRRDADAHERL